MCAGNKLASWKYGLGIRDVFTDVYEGRDRVELWRVFTPGILGLVQPHKLVLVMYPGGERQAAELVNHFLIL